MSVPSMAMCYKAHSMVAFQWTRPDKVPTFWYFIFRKEHNKFKDKCHLDRIY